MKNTGAKISIIGSGFVGSTTAFAYSTQKKSFTRNVKKIYYLPTF